MLLSSCKMITHHKQNKAHITYIMAHLFTPNCPMCGLTKDKRFKKDIKPSGCAIYRQSATSYTMKCKSCGLKFTITWKALFDALKNEMKRYQNEGKDSEARILYVNLLKLNEAVITGGTHRFNPHQ